MGAGASVEEDNFRGIVPNDKERRVEQVEEMVERSEANERFYANQIRKMKGERSLEEEEESTKAGEKFKQMRREQARAVIEEKFPRMKGDFKDTEDKYKKG